MGSFLRVKSGKGCCFIREPQRGGRDCLDFVLCSAWHCGGCHRGSGKELRVDFAIKGPVLAARGIDHGAIYVPAPRGAQASITEMLSSMNDLI